MVREIGKEEQNKEKRKKKGKRKKVKEAACTGMNTQKIFSNLESMCVWTWISKFQTFSETFSLPIVLELIEQIVIGLNDFHFASIE